MSCSLKKGQNENEIWVIKPYFTVTHIRHIEKHNKQLDLRKYKNMSCLLQKAQNKNDFWV